MVSRLNADIVLVTGGAGFIGSAVVRLLLSEGYGVVNLDKLTYAGNLLSLRDVENDPKYSFVPGDICDSELVRSLLTRHRPRAIIHLAAESHVDRSIDRPGQFVQTNVVGTFSLLEQSHHYWCKLTEQDKQLFRFQHISTDEVFGSLGKTGLFTETSSYQPTSPYSASKAGADHLVRAWFHTYGFPTMVSNCSNNYGPYQFPEKLIPLMILNAREGKTLPVYGTGDNVRDWLYVDDHARALQCILENGLPGETYNIGGNCEVSNLCVVRTLCQLLDELNPMPNKTLHNDLITFVDDRPGHDKRYAIDSSKLTRKLGWAPRETFVSGLKKTVTWYLENLAWCEQVQTGNYRRERLGLATG